MGHDVADEGLDVVGVALQLVEVGQLPLLVLEDLVRLLHPGAEGAHLPTELGQLLESGKQPEKARDIIDVGVLRKFKKLVSPLEQLVRVGGDSVVSLLKPLALGLEVVELGGAENVGSGLHQLDDDVERVVDRPVVIVNVILDSLQRGMKRRY